MRKTAQQKFNEYLDECRETTQAVNEFIDRSQENHKNYAYATGALSTIVQEIIAQLPKAKRAEYRQRFQVLAQGQKNELLAKTIKDSDIQRIFDPAGIMR